MSLGQLTERTLAILDRLTTEYKLNTGKYPEVSKVTPNLVWGQNPVTKEGLVVSEITPEDFSVMGHSARVKLVEVPVEFLIALVRII